MFKHLLQTFFILLWTIPLFAQLPDDFTNQLVSNDLDRPVGVTFDKNGRTYVWEQAGKVWILDEEGQKGPAPLLDISDEVLGWKDHGLLGFTLDPDFENNGYIYALYAVDRHHVLYFGTADYDPAVTLENQATIGRITRYTLDPMSDFTSIVADSRKVLLGESLTTGFPILMLSHGIGSLHFGNDGSLLASCGEGATFTVNDHGDNEDTFFAQALEDEIIRPEENVGAFRSLMINSLAGKIIRIDPETGDGMPDNPFYEEDNPHAAASRVWSMGFRNPFRFMVQPETGGHLYEEDAPGYLFIGDVGANLWEELNIATKGGQFFGWPIYEGYERKWDFFWTEDPNYDAPNPLFDAESCTQSYLNFQDLVVDESLNEVFFPHPCDELSEIESSPTFVHARPALAWNNQAWNQPTRVQVGAFDEDGKGMGIDIMDTNSGVDGHIFEGYSSVPGLFYTGTTFPEKYHHALFAGDLYGWIKVFYFDENQKLLKIEPFEKFDKGLADLRVNEQNGCIYYVNVYDNELRRICYGGTPPPVVVAKTNINYGASPLTVELDASETYSPFGSPLTYHWDFGDGETSNMVAPTYVFNRPDNQAHQYNCVLTVTDSVGNSRSDDLIISVNNTPPQVEITSLEDGAYYSIEDISRFPLEAQVEDKEHGEAELSYKWETFFHHNVHYHPETADTQKTTAVLIHPAGCDLETFWYRIRLTVTDAHGLSSMDEKEIFPYCGEIDIDIPELSAVVEGKSIVLNWPNTNEHQIESFYIERTNSQDNYETIGMQQAARDEDVYTFSDDQSVEKEYNFYRLRIKLKNGAYTFSNTVKVYSAIDFKIYPNPMRHDMHLQLARTTSTQLKFELFNPMGQLVFWEKYEVEAKERFRTKTAMPSDLPVGTYYYRLIDGERQYSGGVLVY